MYYFLSNKREEENEIKTKYDSQLVYLDFLVKNEIENTKTLKTIPNSNRLFNLIQSIEKVKISAMDETEYETRNIRTDNSVLIKFKNQNTKPLNIYLKTLTSSKKFVLQLIYFFDTLLKTIEILLTNKLVHNNIGFNTVLINYMEFPVLNNFSYTMNINNPKLKLYLQELLNEYLPESIHRPIEFHILSYLISNKISSLSMHNIKKIIDDVYENHVLLNNFGNNVLTNFKEESTIYYKKFTNKKYDEIINEIILYHTTWDNYALSIIYLNILIGIHKTIQKKNKFIVLFMRLLIENINPNPYKRNTVESTMQKFDFLVQDCDTDDLIGLIKEL